METPMSRRIKRLMKTMGVFICLLLFPTQANGETVNLEPAQPQHKISEKVSHFTWGAEFGTSIDMSGYDSSTFNIDAVAGYRNPWFKILGMGIGLHRAIGSGDNYVPLYALMRTSFSRRPQMLFMSMKVGYSFNTIGDAPTFGDVNASAGIGINLAKGKTFSSHMILAYEFRHFNNRHRSEVEIDAEDISLVSLSFGVNF